LIKKKTLILPAREKRFVL